MATRDFTIYTLNAFELINILKGAEHRADLCSVYDRDRILVSDGKYGDSGLNSQILRALGHHLGRKASADDLTECLVYLKFGRGLGSAQEADIRKLIDEGFILRVSENSGYCRFVPFDKSASMARESTISFIREDLFDEVDEAVGLGIDWTSLPLIPSKYYAYRGLYMTDGIAIDDSDFVLNEKTVIVVKSEGFTLKGLDLITVGDQGYGEISVSTDSIVKKDKMKVTPYDGEGLIDPEYSRILARSVRKAGKSDPVSFQVRMPFAKGMLHCADWKMFFRDRFPEEKYEDIYIEDCYGIRRHLSEARIILTDSMFKCGKWLEKLFGVYKLQEKNGKSKEVVDYYLVDPMKYYFEKFAEYGHSAYIVRTDANLKNNGKVTLNYQFLNTLDMEPETLRELTEEHTENARRASIDPAAARQLLLGRDDAAEWDTEPDSYHIAEMEPWEYALTMNSAFARDPFLAGRIKDAEKAGIRDIYRGRITCDGANKFLSGDLLSLLIHLAACATGSGGKAFAEAYTDRIAELRAHTLKSDRFYMPLRKGESLDVNMYYGLLRNPHLSRNEECALRPQKDPLYNTYFSRLKDVIMVSDKSTAPAILGGADFDGDIVKFIRDRRVNAAILRGAYEETEPVEEYISRKDMTIKHRRYVRRLPVVYINSPGGEPSRVGRRISYEDLEKAFSSRVGSISNAAVTIGRMEYGSAPEGVTVEENTTALCTIATGLEIDSVKTGRKPEIRSLLSLAGKVEDKYLSIDKTMKDLAADSSRKNRVVYAEYDDETDSYTVFLRHRKQNLTDTGRDKLFVTSGGSGSNIDMLPYCYAKALAEDKAVHAAAASDDGERCCFAFERQEGWREDALADARRSKLEGYIGAYRKLYSDAVSDKLLHGEMNSGSFRGSILTLLFTEYDTDKDVLPLSEASIGDTVDVAYQELYRFITTAEQADDILERMREHKWQFVTDYKSRAALIEEILGAAEVSPAASEIICDSYDNGYQILNYLLQDIRAYRAKEAEGSAAENAGSEAQPEGSGVWTRAIDKDLYGRIYRIYNRNRALKKNRWSAAVRKYCRDAVLELFGGDIERAVMCTVALDKEVDERHSFLWNVFTTGDIKSSVYKPAVSDETGLKALAKAFERR